MLDCYFKPFMADVVFKEALYNNIYALEDFLECLTNLKRGSLKNKIKKISYESMLNKDFINNQDRRCDMLITIDDYLINLEFYRSFGKNELNKSITYIMSLLTSNAKKKNNKYQLDKIIQINIVENNRILPKDKIVHNYKQICKDDMSDIILKENYQVYCIDIDLVESLDYTIDIRTQKWLKFLKANSMEEMESIGKRDEIFMKLISWLKNYFDEKENEKFFREWANNNKYLSGKEEGLEQGKEEAHIQTATNMLKANFDEKTITKITGLPLEKIKKIKTTLL